ncbi:hypothetical protein VE03_02667 [Pseudogymnoascus sp. 23342-1-I1]|nr:hypothetical protein VE03_02667 [Pseudogymnoascus sp. 23342-1-I1]
MADLDSYNSDDDVVFTEEPRSNLGRRLAERMLESALEHRKTSKNKYADLKMNVTVTAMKEDFRCFGFSLQRYCHRAGFSPLRILTTASSVTRGNSNMPIVKIHA